MNIPRLPHLDPDTDDAMLRDLSLPARCIMLAVMYWPLVAYATLAGVLVGAALAWLW